MTYSTEERCGNGANPRGWIKIYDTLDLLHPPPGAVLGNHAVWIPSLGVKLPFQFGGRITKRTRQEATYPLDTIVDEVCIMRALAAEGMAPPVGDLVYFKNVISDYPGGWHCDPCGAFGYEIADARKLPPGRFSVEAMRKLSIQGSDGAWNDISVTERGNVVNGYLVDVRRTAWDMLRWGGVRFGLPDVREDAGQLAADFARLCSFPKGERPEAYQSFYLDGRWHPGQRQVVERAALLGFAPRRGETVLEIGCQSGGFLQLAALAGADAIGVEVDPDYVDCARRLARHAGHNICVRQLDAVAERKTLLQWLHNRAPGGVDHLLLLSMEKHLGEAKMFALVDAINARRTYIETNAVAKDDGRGAEPAGAMKLWEQVQARRGVHVGNTRDRNLRRLYRIDRR